MINLEEAFDVSKYEIENFLSSVMEVREDSAASIARTVVDKWSQHAYKARDEYDALDSDVAYAMVKNMYELLENNPVEGKLQLLGEIQIRLIIRELKNLIEN